MEDRTLGQLFTEQENPFLADVARFVLRFQVLDPLDDLQLLIGRQLHFRNHFGEDGSGDVGRLAVGKKHQRGHAHDQN